MPDRLHSSATSVRALHWTVQGVGSIGRRHLRNLLSLGAEDLRALRRAPDPIEGELSAVSVVTNLEPAADDRSVVVICSPTAAHAADGVAALRLGHHVLLEKPVGVDAEDGSRLAAAAAASGRRVMVASCLRFHPVLVALRDRVQSGSFGRVHWTGVWCGQHLADWRPGRDYRDTYSARRAEGGGVLLDLIHEIDYLQWIFGAASLEWAAVGSGDRLGIDVEETADLAMRCGDGLLASCHLDMLSRPATRGGVLLGDRGGARWDLAHAALDLRVGGAAEWHPTPLPANWIFNQIYLDELAACARVVEGHSGNPSPLSDGVRALETVLAAKRLASRREEAPC